MESTEQIDVDVAWQTLGKFGRYQVLQFLILSLSGIPMSFHLLSVVFIGKDVEHVCNSPSDTDLYQNATVMLESCEIKIFINTSNTTEIKERACPDGYNYTDERYKSFVSEWDLVCENEALGKLSQTLVMVGMFLGASFLPTLADRFGRKLLHVGMHFLLCVVTVAMAFVPVFTAFAVLRVLVGICHQGYLIPLFIMTLELFPAKQRELIGFSGSLLWALSILLITPIAYSMRFYSWRSMQLVLAVFSSFSVVEVFVLDESLRWLVANKKTKETINIIKKACKINHKDFNSTLQTIVEKSKIRVNLKEDKQKMSLLNEDVVAEDEQEKSNKAMDVSFLDILRNPALRPVTLIVTYTWCVNACTYYGLALLSSSLAGDQYINFLLGAVLEIVAYFVMWFLLEKYGRKKTCIFFHTSAGVALLITVLVATFAEESPTSATVQTVFSLIGRSSIAGSFNSIWIYTPELFPTNIRNIGLGMASSAARIAGMASPFFNSLARVAIWAPGTIFTVACFLVSFLMTFLPETSGRELPQTIEEMVNWQHSEKRHKTKTKTSFFRKV